ncbi:MAG: hypothetical protein HKO56_02215 [Bacteroidia bacterium]|nr:hypothetical protein [Bacteroidia bacterium]NNC84643.1 hypothetical protein [Bacteroidia bacterium]NNM15445.1 hypothetical protein [Bacteroidia bacterium]
MNKLFSLILVFSFLTFACTKEKTYLYEVNPVTVEQDGANKNNLKSDFEFISIAYSDLFGTTISRDDLVDLSLAYASFGDRKLVEDMIIRNFLNSSSVNIPTSTQMRSDIPQFISDTYGKLFNRAPNEFESWYVVNLIENDMSITSEIVYYSFMTSNEYRYY